MSMKKIMFNDRFGLTEAVIEGRKTVTRRIIDNNLTQSHSINDDGSIELVGYKRAYRFMPKYKVGEIVAVAQNYREVWEHLKTTYGSSSSYSRDFYRDYVLAGRIPASNKMFVRADLMPHQIRILSVRAERLQDITDEDCLREGIYKDDCKTYFNGYAFELTRCEGNCILATHWYKSPRGAYSDLIDKISGKGTWNANPWVWRIEFELIN